MGCKVSGCEVFYPHTLLTPRGDSPNLTMWCTKSMNDGYVYVLRDPSAVVRQVCRTFDPQRAEWRKPAGYSLEFVYSSQNPAEIVVMQRAISTWLGLMKAPGAGSWPSHIASPSPDELLSAEAKLDVDAGLDQYIARLRWMRREADLSGRHSTQSEHVPKIAADRVIRSTRRANNSKGLESSNSAFHTPVSTTTSHNDEAQWPSLVAAMRESQSLWASRAAARR